MTIKCFTVATHIDGYYDILLQSCKRNNINIHVLGKGEKYINHLFKTYKTIEFLKKQKSDQIVLFIDGFDSIVLENINIIEKEFLKLKLPFVFSQDIKYNYYKNLALKFFIKINSTNNYIFNNLLTISRPCFLDSKYTYINSGLFIGYSKYLLKIFEKSLNFVKYYNHNSNQRLLQDMCNEKTKIFVDSKNVIFHNFSHRDKIKFKNKKIYINNKKSCIISKPGLGDLSTIALYLKYDISFIKKRNLLLYYLGGSNKRTVLFVFIVNILFLLIFLKISKMYYMKYSLNSK